MKTTVPSPPKKHALGETTAPFRRDHTVVASAPKPGPATASNLRPTPTRVFINREWYLQVDREGFIDGLWFEGAFGCVLPMYHVHDNERLALKIPRLLADTVRENEFIRHIVETEARIVAVANRGVAYNSGLVPTQEIAHDLLRGRRDFLDAEDPVLAAQHGCVLLFSFRKGRPPRVVSVKIDEAGGLVVFPPGAAQDVSQFLNKQIWDELREPNAKHALAGEMLQRNFREPYYFELKERTGSAARTSYGPMIWTMSPDREPVVWYSGLPSIIYKWAPGTLQRAVSQRAHMQWRLVDHYDLHRQIARGIVTLHSKNLIHGDPRPANIMMMGGSGASGALERPEEYAVGDYGAFSVDRSRTGPNPALSGHTMTGAGVSRQRTSMFYAPERRYGYERENADVAIVKNFGRDTKYYMLCLGWGSALFSPGSTELRPELLADLKNHWNELLTRTGVTPDTGLHELPRDGDRLRLRDYVFEVRASKTTPDMSLFLVDRRYAQVLHERVAVYSPEEEELADGAVITLPMYTELHQWSAATDIYGIGTLALYTLMMSAVQRHYDAQEEFDESLNTRFESIVAELIGRLGNARDAVEFWGDLDLFWVAVEQLSNSKEPDDVNERSRRLELELVPGHNITMVAFAIKTTNNLLRIKNMKYLLSCFRHDLVSPRDGRNPGPAETRPGPAEYNLAHFLFFVHFLMSCMHRRQALAACRSDGSYERVLCHDRCEKPTQDGVSAAEQALQRLTMLQERVNSPDFRGFLVVESGLDFEYRAESEFQLQRRCNQLRDHNAALVQLMRNLRANCEGTLTDMEGLVRSFTQQRLRIFGINGFLGSMRACLERGLRGLDPRVRTFPGNTARDSDAIPTGSDPDTA